jgi:hypothetical protein
MKKSHQFSIEERDSVYYLLDNGEQVTTPNGQIACTKSQELAGILVKNANATKGAYTKPTDLLCYFYSTLDFTMQWNEEQTKEYVQYLTNCLVCDPYLMFRQPCPVRQAIEQFFVNHLSETLNELPPHRLVCYIILNTVYQSPMLAQYIVADIIDGEGEYEDLKQEFLDDLKEFCREEGLIFNRRKYSDMIDKFVAYYTIDEI